MFIKRYTVIAFFAIWWTSASCQKDAQISFSYPFEIGDTLWQQYSNNKERVKALQIPEDRLSHIPTNELLEICLDYPFLLEFLFCDDIQEGLKSLTTKFNGFKELIGRKDLPIFLLAKEQKLQEEVESILFKNNQAKGRLGFKSLVVELLLLHEEVFSYMTETQKNDFLHILDTNKKTKNNYPDIFGGINNYPEYLLLEIKNASNDKKQNNRLGPNYSSVEIYTPNGTLVPDAKVLTSGDVSYSSDEISDMANTLYIVYNEAQLIEPPTYKMNNWGYTWYTSETSQKVVIGYSNLYADTVFWGDKSYIEVPEEIATKVKYDPIGGASAVRESNTWYVSKWSFAGPLVRHHPNNVPDYYYPNSMNRKYYMRNPNCSITGPALIASGNGFFSVQNLPSGFTTSWSISDSYYNNGYNLLIPNYPTTGHCMIFRDQNHDLKNDTLKAHIKYNGVTVLSLKKIVNAYDDFWGQYTSGNLSGEINYSHYFAIKTNTVTTVTSPNLYGATVTYDSSGATPTSWTFYPTYGTLYFTAPAGYIPVIINVHDGCGNDYVLYAYPAAFLYNISISYGEDGITVALIGDGDSEMGLSQDQSWTVEARSATTGQLMATQSSTSRSETISTAGWPKGIYIVKVTVGKEVLTEKVIVK